MWDVIQDFFTWFSWPWLPEDGGGFSKQVDFLVGFLAFVTYFFVALIGGLMVLFNFRYRQKDRNEVGRGAHHSTPVELAWTLPPLVIVLLVFVFGFTGFLDMATPPQSGNAYEIRAEAYKWGWNFYYPNGASDPSLYIPADRPTKLILESKDVIHSLYIPAFRIKKDVVPGRFNTMWFEPDASQVSGVRGQTEKAFPLHCAEYCGQGHSQMNTQVIVVHGSAWDAKLAELMVWNKDGKSPVELGEQIWAERGGCKACHSIDGSRGTGPTWKDLYGAENHPLVSGGPVTVDYDYIHESIRQPNAKFAAGFPNGGMAAYPETQLNAGDIYALVEFMKSISSHAQGEPALEAFPEGYTGDEELPAPTSPAPGSPGAGSATEDPAAQASAADEAAQADPQAADGDVESADPEASGVAETPNPPAPAAAQ